MKHDIELLQGIWKIESLEMDGHTIPGAALRGASITIQDGHFTSAAMGAAYEPKNGSCSAVRRLK